MNLLLFLALCTITFSAKNNKKTEKVNTEKFLHYHEIIHHINLLKNNPKENFKDLNNKILEYKNKCPNGFCYPGEEIANVENVIKNRLALMREFNENLFREKRGTNRRISRDVEDGMVKSLEDLHMLEEHLQE